MQFIIIIIIIIIIMWPATHEGCPMKSCWQRLRVYCCPLHFLLLMDHSHPNQASLNYQGQGMHVCTIWFPLLDFTLTGTIDNTHSSSPAPICSHTFRETIALPLVHPKQIPAFLRRLICNFLLSCRHTSIVCPPEQNRQKGSSPAWELRSCGWGDLKL